MKIENSPANLDTISGCRLLAEEAHTNDHISSLGTGNNGTERLQEEEMIRYAQSNIEGLKLSIGQVIALSKNA